MKKRIFLASSSPRRKRIFELMKVDFEVLQPKDVEETKFHGKPVKYTVLYNAKLKAINSLQKIYKGIYISCDTEVFFDGKIFGKPENKEDAIKMLKILSGKKHIVASGVYIIDNFWHNEEMSFYDISYVEFKNFSERDIKEYIESNDVLDKAGAYAVQYNEKSIVKNVEGSIWNVVGFPVEHFYEKIKRKKYYHFFKEGVSLCGMSLYEISKLLNLKN